MNLTVIICTYNPNPLIFFSCLQSITKAIQVFSPVEIILIDNNSTIALNSIEYVCDFLRQTPLAKIFSETQPGLTKARLRGIRESSGDLLVFVDDDNILYPDFFKNAYRIGREYKFIGAFSGQVFLDFQKAPHSWTKRYWGLLVKREFYGNHWSNNPLDNDCMPAGAGLCIRRSVANYYLKLHERGEREILLDRTKDSLLSGGDNDMAMCACDIGLGMGIFEELKINHIIPPSRTTKTYLSNLAYGIYYSSIVLKYMRNYPITPITPAQKIVNRLRRLMMKRMDAKISLMCDKGVIDALNWISRNTKKNN